MAWRKWLVRSVVFTVAGAVVAAAFAYQHWTSPAIVRLQVIANLEERLPGARVSLESARLQVIGGISFKELHLSRRDDPGRTDFIHVPSGTIAHDKEQLLSGKLAIRRIDWYKPTVHLIRGEEGGWNVAGLAAPSPEIALPTIVLHQAKIKVEDRQLCADAFPVEVRDANLVLMNEAHRSGAISLLTFKGTGVADLAGTVQAEGTIGLQSGEFTASITLPCFPIDGSLVQRLSTFCPEAGIHGRQLTGTGKLQAEISYHPQSEQPWRHEVRWQLSGGKFSHARLPFPLEDVDASVRCVDGQVTLEKLTARSGSAQFRLLGKALAPNVDADVLDGRLEVDHLPVTKELFEALPRRLQEVEQEYAPQGTFSLQVDFSRRAGQWRLHSIVTLEDMAGACAKFPYRLEHVTGTIDQETDPSRSLEVLKLDLIGYTGSQPVSIRGEATGQRPAALTLQIRTKDVPIDDKLCAALLQREFQDLVRSFRPRGCVDVDAYICRPPGGKQFANQYILHFHDAHVTYDVFPYPLEHVNGTLIIQPDHWEYRDFQGTHKGADIRSQGRSVQTPQGKGAEIEITGSNVLLDAELRAALKQPAVETAWQKLNLSGLMNFVAHVDILQKQPEIDVLVTPRGCTIQPEFFPYALADLHGTVHYRKHGVELQTLSAHHGSTLLSLERGNVSFNADGGFSVNLVNLQGNPIVLDPELIRALPTALSQACTGLRLKEPMSLRTNLTVAVPAAPGTPPHIHWDGGVRLKDATLLAGVPCAGVCGIVWSYGEHRGGVFGPVHGNFELARATVFNQTLRDIHSQILVDPKEPDFLVLPNLEAHLHGGEVGGKVRIKFGPSMSYEAELTALHMELEEFSRSNRLGPNAQQSGLVNAHLYLKGQGTDLSGLKGSGSIDVPNGKMYNLPLLLDLLKVLGLRWPDRTFFDEAHARFTIDGQRVDISRIDLLGAAISLGGHGTVDLKSSAFNMELYAVWGRIVQLSPPLIKEIWPKLSEQLLKIKMKGKIGETPRIEKELVPGLTEPLEKVLERLGSRQKG